ncbi:hypothetical protein T06_10272 [Trichinella sp. T6]|nr:hypothetical protein T06_10272 [Trichinella sp. T6]
MKKMLLMLVMEENDGNDHIVKWKDNVIINIASNCMAFLFSKIHQRLLKRICTNAKFSQSYNIVMKGVDLHDRLAAAYHLIYLNYVLCNNTKIVTLNYQIVALVCPLYVKAGHTN